MLNSRRIDERPDFVMKWAVVTMKGFLEEDVYILLVSVIEPMAAPRTLLILFSCDYRIFSMYVLTVVAQGSEVFGFKKRTSLMNASSSTIVKGCNPITI